MKRKTWQPNFLQTFQTLKLYKVYFLSVKFRDNMFSWSKSSESAEKVQNQRTSDIPPECPMHASCQNPDNNIPNLPQEAVPGQAIPLPAERQISTIPKHDGSQWIYPSEQQFYNALHRKGKATDEKDVSMMLMIHNDINERCWQEVKSWESQFTEYHLYEM
jgi:hypothetical protein